MPKFLIPVFIAFGVIGCFADNATGVVPFNALRKTSGLVASPSAGVGDYFFWDLFFVIGAALFVGFGAGYGWCWLRWWTAQRRLPKDLNPNFVNIKELVFCTRAGYAFHNLDCCTIDGSYVCILNRKTALNCNRSACKKCEP